jgi:flavin-dependent dehydrogenase
MSGIGRTERVLDKRPNPGTANKAGEVIVVGGSAAGLLTAAKVAAGGRSVRVLDAKEGLDPAPRSLIVTHHFREQLQEVASSSIVNEIKRFELFTDGRSAEVALRRPDLIIERAKLIPALAHEASKAGAKISFDSHFLGLGPNSRGLRLEVETAGKREELHADHVVGADGATSRVGRSAGWPPVETVPLVQAIVKLPKDCRPDTTRVWFVPDDTPYFYWLIPENESRGALGIIGEGSGQETKKRIERFLEKKNMQPLEWQGARIPVYRKWIPVERRVGNGKVFLVGDAAAQVKVSTVGGIVTGFRGAQGVADALLGSHGSRELRVLRRELDTHWLIRKTMHHFQQKDYSYLVDLLNLATRESLGEIHRDHSTRLLWNVIRHQPRLVLLGLRGLLMGKKPR